MSSQPLVSIVTPVYNERKHLAECIESVLAQSYANWDYTIVDNCSTDGTAEIARQYAARDPRIRVLECREFLRALPNFNRALRQISLESKYCKVVLGDDWIFPECLERMVAVAEANPSVGLVSAYALEGTQVICAGLPVQATFVPGQEICRRHFLDGLYVFGSPTNVLYRADLVRDHDPFFNETNIHADTEVCFVLLKTSDFAFVHQVLTFSRVRQDSRSATDLDNQTDFGGFLETLLKHGPAFLSPEELKTRRDQHISEYHNFLGKSLIVGRDRTFWKYNETKLIEAGVGFSRMRVARGAISTALDIALNPKSGIEKILKRRQRQSGSQVLESKPVTTSGMADWAASGSENHQPLKASAAPQAVSSGR
ncbi:MAG TPA: glycosyltransferase family A protein [Terriglobia bacterium]|nr:glycosyltransferase family A protein [Terriglobia bacterium]